MSVKNSLNIFDQYTHLENRLTHALGVTLERSSIFRENFIKDFTGKKRFFGKVAHVELQLAKGASTEKDPDACIPDLVILNNTDQAIIIESKVGAGITMSQLTGHEKRARRNALEIYSALVITGRKRDAEKLLDWSRAGRVNEEWKHISWRQVYQLASQYADEDPWSRELQQYMNILSSQMDDSGMDSQVKIIDFTGIPFTSFEDFDFRVAKRILRSLMDTLDEDRNFLKTLGFKKDQIPRHRKKISTGTRVWDYLSPVDQDKSHKGSHHFTVSISQDHMNAMLTVPNGPVFRRFRKNVSRNNAQDFDAMVKGIMKNLSKEGILKAGGQPVIKLVQRRYKTRQNVFAVDGEMSFDIRTTEGQRRTGKIPPIEAQPEWLHLCKSLILNKKGNVQLQIGVQFYYSHCPAIKTPKATELVKKSLASMAPAVSLLEL